MRRSIRTSLAILFLLAATHAAAEVQEKTYAYQKGQVVDFLFAIQNPDSGALLKTYFDEAIPIAVENGYQPLPGFRPGASPTQGNFHPDFIAIGAWPSVAQRKRALHVLESRLPEFHQWRRDIWSVFGVTYYEMPEDVSFVYRSDRLHVLTAYWAKDPSAFKTFERRWAKEATRAGGRLLLELKDGESPFGYHHRPDYMTLTQWDDQAAFDAFLAKNRAMDHGSVEHVHQFPVTPPPPKGK
ncbi:MAG: hypothetical protein AAGD06_29860 [Acidobacteriota bacterium]